MITNTELAEKYQNGDMESGYILLQRFQPLIKKYANILYHNKINTKDKQTVKFLKLLASKNSDRPISKAKKILSVVRSVLLTYEYEDVLSDIQLLFIELIKIYNKELLDFNGFIYFYFNYKILNYIKKIAKNNPITVTLSELSESIDVENIYDVLNIINENPDNTSIYNVMDINWINGLTCDDLFKTLSKEDRLILKLYYVDHISGKEIANLLNKHHSTIYEQLKIIKNKLANSKKLNKENDIIINGLLNGKTQKEISMLIGKHQSTIARRIKEISKKIS